MPIDVFNPVGSALNDNIDRKNRITDYLTNYHFHVMDVSFSNPQVFSLSYGFKYVTGIEIQADVKEFKEGTFEYPRKVITGAKVTDVSLHRGAKFFDSDFSDWITSAIKASGPTNIITKTPLSEYRKNLLVIQYSDISTGIGSGTLGPLSFQSLTQLVNLVPARAWMLYDCIPTVYKAATDFDAAGADISIMELTVSPRYSEEFNTGI